MDTKIESPLSLSLNELAEATTHCFEGYVVPLQLSGPMVAGMIRTEAIDLAASLVASDDDGPVGVVLIARRDKVSRIAAMAIAKRARRQGLGKRLLHQVISEARERRDVEMRLEVIEQNPPAIALYEDSGFTIARRLLGFTATLDDCDAKPVEDCSMREVAVATSKVQDLPWQINAATIEQFASPLFAVRLGQVYAALAPAGAEVLVGRGLAWSDPTELRGWLEAMGARFPGKKLRLPPYCPESDFGKPLREAGMEQDTLSQFEMRLPLD